MKKKILTFILSSSFIFADCSEPIKNANSNNQSACVKATECLKNEITQLVDILQELEDTSKRLDKTINIWEQHITKCQNWKAYSIKEPTVKRWQILVEDCEGVYTNLGKSMMAKTKVVSNTSSLKRQIEALGASIPYIKDKCNNGNKVIKDNIAKSELKLADIGYSLDGCDTFIKLTDTNQLNCMRAKICLENEMEELYQMQRGINSDSYFNQQVAKANLNAMKKNPNLLHKEIKASEASLEYIKDKCKF